MKFQEVPLNGAYLIELEPIQDERGYFARSWCQKEFEKKGLVSNVVQCNISFNKKKGTLRGLHYQVFPHQEAKLVSCTRGSIYDVMIDLRPQSSTFRQCFSLEISENSNLAIYIPEGFAHGFQTLENCTQVFYQMFNYFKPESARGIRWSDPSFNIKWPVAEKIISAKDQSYSDFKL